MTTNEDIYIDFASKISFLEFIQDEFKQRDFPIYELKKILNNYHSVILNPQFFQLVNKPVQLKIGVINLSIIKIDCGANQIFINWPVHKFFACSLYLALQLLMTA